MHNNSAISCFWFDLVAVADFLLFHAGEKAAFIDYMIWPWLERLPVLTQYNSDVNMTSFPLVRQWREEMLCLPEVQKCLFSTDHHVEFYAKWRGGDQTAFDIGLSSGA